MGNRYDNRRVFKNREKAFQDLFDRRDIKFVRHYNTAIIVNPSVENSGRFEAVQHIWATGDRFYKLAAQYYKIPTYWWVIAQYNQKPTEAHVKIGEPIWIPIPLEAVLSYMG